MAIINLNPRERNIVFVVVGVIGLWILDQYALSPFLDKRSALASQLTEVKSTAEQNDLTIARDRINTATWTTMQVNGLRSDPSVSESLMQHAINDDWARDAGLNLQSVKREKLEPDKQFGRIVFKVAATGTMQSISRFLWNIQQAKLPVRVVDLAVTPRKDGADDLSLNLGLSTLVAGSVPTTSPAGVPAAGSPAFTGTPSVPASPRVSSAPRSSSAARATTASTANNDSVIEALRARRRTESGLKPLPPASRETR